MKNWWRDRVAKGLEEAVNSLADLVSRLFANAGKGGGGGGGDADGYGGGGGSGYYDPTYVASGVVYQGNYSQAGNVNDALRGTSGNPNTAGAVIITT